MAKIPAKVLSRLVSSLKKFQAVLENAKAKDINESDTVAIVIDMLAELYGYDKYSEVTSELAVKRSRCDLAIKTESKLRFIIEVKAIGLDLKDDHINQVVDYGCNKGVEWVILTNGIFWKIFAIRFGKPIGSELVYEFNILELNPKRPSDLELLYYVSKESLGKSALEEYKLQQQILSKYFIGQVLTTKPVLDSIRKTIKKINTGVKVSVEEIKNVLVYDVLKREVLEDEKSDEAKRRINKVFKTMGKKERSHKENATGTKELTPEQKLSTDK